MKSANLQTSLQYRFADRPLALAPRAVDAVMSSPRAMFGGDIAPAQRDQGWELTDGGIAILPIFGPLLQRSDEFTRWLGIAAYDDIGDVAQAAFAAPNVRGVLLEIDSPGGEVAGLFDLVDHLANIKATYGKPLWAISREQALSAAYAIAVIADRIYTTQTGEVGSVGVLAVHVDRSVHDAAEGETYTLIHAGAKKTDGNPHIPLSDRAASDIQADVDDLYARFITRVARSRRMSREAVTATEAAIYRGQHALDAGLADVVGTFESAHADLLKSLDAPLAHTAAQKNTLTTSQSQERTTTMTTKAKPVPTAAIATKPETNTPTAATYPELEPGDQTLPAEDAGTAASIPPVLFTHTEHGPITPPATDALAVDAKNIRAEAAEIAKIGAEAAKLGLTIDVPTALTAGTKPDALRRAVLEQLAATTDATIIASFAPRVVDAAPKKSPLIAAAEAAAKTA